MWRRASAILLVACACGTHDAPDAALDGGPDAEPMDGGPDVGRDASRSDVGDDAGDAPLPAGWRYVSGSFPATTRLAFAEPELVAATSFPIETCPDRSGCRRIVQTWPSGMCSGMPLPCSPFTVVTTSGEHDGTRGMLVISRPSPGAFESWVIDDDGHALAGLRSDVTTAYAAPGNVHGGSLAAMVVAGTEEYMLVIPIASPFAFTDLGEVNRLAGGLDVIQRFTLGDGAVAGEMRSLVVERIPLDGSLPAIVTDGEGTLGAIVGDAIFFDRFTGPPGDVRVARPGEASEVLITGPQTNATRIATDGHDLVWVEYDYDSMGDGTNFAVWAAPYVEHAVDLVARRIDSPALGGTSLPIVVGFGLAAVPDGTGGLRLYRLADGYHADLAAPAADVFWMPPAYIGPTEIALAARASDPYDTRELCFIELASLDWLPTP